LGRSSLEHRVWFTTTQKSSRHRGAVLVESVEIRSVIVIVSKRLSPLVAADNDVIEQSGCEDSRTTGYVSSLRKNGGIAVKTVLIDMPDSYLILAHPNTH
jgi:hypothetical protein